MNILITGSTGFVGTNLQEYLAKTGLPFTIYNLSRSELAGSVLDFSKLLKDQNINTIVHLAGKAHDLKKKSTPEEYYLVNAELTTKLYEAFADSNASKFIFISSVKAVADKVVSNLSESFVPAPATDYGKSKLLAEYKIQTTILSEGKSFYILRPCMIHGPGNKGNFNLLYDFARRGIPYPLAAFKNKRSFLSITNLCFVINSFLLRQNIPSGIYHVADEEALSTNRMMEIFGEVMGKAPRMLNISPRLIRAIARLGDILPLPINSERLQKLTENYLVSNKKLIDALGEPLPIMSEEGLRITVQSFYNNADGKKFMKV